MHAFTTKRAVVVAVLIALLTAAIVAAPGASSQEQSGGDPELSESLIKVGPELYMGPASLVAQSDEGAQDESASAPRTWAELEPQIVGGRRTKIGKWPWQAGLQSNEGSVCGGSLVAPRIVISAAHCVWDFEDGFFKDPADHFVVTGRTRLFEGDGGQEHSLVDYYVFFDQFGNFLWNPNTFEWDVIVILLTAPGSTQKTIKIAGPGEKATWAPGRDAFATGWGATRFGEGVVDHLREAKIEVIKHSRCASMYEKAGGQLRVVAQTMVCSGNQVGKKALPGLDVCKGDSGGPLVVPLQGGGWRLIGAHSWSTPDGCALLNRPGVAARLAADPLRTSISNLVEQQLTGDDVIGGGGRPTNHFRFGKADRRPGAGTAELPIRVSGAGELILHDSKKVKGDSVSPEQAGWIRLFVEPRGKALRQLNNTGVVTVPARVSFHPNGGERGTDVKKVFLVKNR